MLISVHIFYELYIILDAIDQTTTISLHIRAIAYTVYTFYVDSEFIPYHIPSIKHDVA